MKSKIFLFCLLFFVLACKKTEKTEQLGWIRMSERISFEETPNMLNLKSGKFSYQFKKKDLPFKRVVLLNSSLTGYFTCLGAYSNLVGLASPEYVYSAKIRNLLKSNHIKNIGNEQKYDVEAIIALKPDVLFTNYVQSFENTYDVLQKQGIKLIFLDEYLEPEPLEKSAYIKLFGKLLGKEKEANEIFRQVKTQYLDLKARAMKEPITSEVITNEMYGGSQWFLLGGNTQLANFLKDVNADYILKDNHETRTIPTSFEEVYVKAQNARYWIISGTHPDKKHLLQSNPNYAKLKVFQIGKIYSFGGRLKEKSNDFFETGNVRVDSVMMDFVKVFHPNILPNHRLVYMNELK